MKSVFKKATGPLITTNCILKPKRNKTKQNVTQQLTACADNFPSYRESMPDFRKRSPEKIEKDPAATPPAPSKLAREENPFLRLPHTHTEDGVSR